MESLQLFCKYLPMLSILNVGDCRGLSSDTFEWFPECPLMHTLVLFNIQLEDKQLITILQKCPNLEKVYLLDVIIGDTMVSLYCRQLTAI
jgi:hypothetical protein